MFRNIVILTGAGLSAESGLSTFRDPSGIWSQYDWREVATIESFRKNPDRVHAFYNMRRRAHADIAPNAAHAALARLEATNSGVTIVTQNVDALHEAAGSQNLIHMHGEIFKVFCTHCNVRQIWRDELSQATSCPACSKSGGMRPDVVWFGETPYHMARIFDLLRDCDLFISIGTSGNVYPAAGFVTEARTHGAKTVELNLEPSSGATQFHDAIYGPATDVVPRFVERLINGTV
jgi:NAD-dependent deacetylase